MKKGWVVLLFAIVCLVLPLLFHKVAADSENDGTRGDELYWGVDDDGVLTITGEGEMDDYTIGQAPWYSYRSSVTSIVIESGVTSIGTYAFANFKKTTVLTLAQSVTTIKSNAFYLCSALTSVEYGGTKVYQAALTIEEGNDVLQEAEWHYRMGELAASGSCGTNVTWAWYDDGLLVISGEGAMNDYGSSNNPPYNAYKEIIYEVVIENGVTTIGNYSFSGCGNMTRISLPNGLVVVGNGAFHLCESLSTITLPEGLTSIGEECFSDCKSLESIVIPEGIKRIENYTFSYCESLKSVELPDSLTYIGFQAFSFCSSLEEIDLPEDFTTLYRQALSYSGLVRFTVPEAITRLEQGNQQGSGFMNCSNLTAIYLHKGLTYIHYGNFQNCSNLTDVYYAGTEEEYRQIEFSRRENSTYGGYNHGVKEYEGATVHFNSEWVVKSGSLTDTITWTRYSTGKLTISGTGDMPEFSSAEATPWFNKKDRINVIEIEEGITSVSANAFAGFSEVTEVILPHSLISIGDYAFSMCEKLEEVKFGALTSSIGEGAFLGCAALSTATFSYQINQIGEDAFLGCTSLNAVYYGGTEAEWGEVTISDGNDSLLSAPFNPEFGYQIRFISEKQIVQSGKVHYGKMPVCTRIPKKEPVEDKKYFFAEWTPEIVLSVEDTQYLAVYDEVTIAYHWIETESGYSVQAVSVCDTNEAYNAEESVEAESEIMIEPLCEETGLKRFTAQFETEWFDAQTKDVVLDAIGHEWNEPIFVWNDDNTATASRTCRHDTNHIEALSVEITCEVLSPASCESDGIGLFTATTVADGVSYSDKREGILSATGHDYALTGWAWAEDLTSASATFTCRNDVTHVETTEAIVALETTDATCEEAGKTLYTATVVFEGETYTDVKEVVIPALGHDYELTGWTWAEDYSTAEAIFTCKNDASHVETITGAVTFETTAATCEEAGKTVYTVIADFEGETYTDMKEISIPALGHDWDTPVVMWNGVESATATRVCKNDADHKETVDCAITSEVIEEPTATTEGLRIYTATAEFPDGMIAKSEKEEVIPAYGWTWSRLAGSNRYQTATLATQVVYADDSCDKIIIASGQAFPDALSGSALAGVFGCPILLTNKLKLSPDTKSEILRLAAPGCKVLILGGNGAVSADVEAEINELGIVDLTTERVKGSNREATAAAVFEMGLKAGGFRTGGTIIVATGYSYADVLSISPYSYAAKAPIVLAKKDGSLSADTMALIEEKIRPSQVIIIGGSKAVSQEAQEYLSFGGTVKVMRLSGSNRYVTSAEIMRWELGMKSDAPFQPEVEMHAEGMGVATGANFADALGAVSLLGKTSSVMLLVADNNKTNQEATQANINELIAPFTKHMTKGYIFGGKGAVSLKIEQWLNDAVK